MQLTLARRISDITLRRGGIDEITVVDDGCGMSADDMVLAVKRHATSKLPDDSLTLLIHWDFVKPLPSIGAVSLLSLTSVKADFAHAWRVIVDGGRVSDPQPAALVKGSLISVTQLLRPCLRD